MVSWVAVLMLTQPPQRRLEAITCTSTSRIANCIPLRRIRTLCRVIRDLALRTSHCSTTFEVTPSQNPWLEGMELCCKRLGLNAVDSQ